MNIDPKNTVNTSDIIREWKVVIKVQMHFNDLLIKYRTAVVSVFVTLGGAVITLSEISSTKNVIPYIPYMVAFLLFFWITAFCIDYFYYLQLLIGAVEHAKKFDNNPEYQKLGLFGLTEEIANKVSNTKSLILVILFYFGAPIGLFFLYCFVKLLG